MLGSIDRIVMGLVTKTMFRTDEYMAEEVTNHLFQVKNKVTTLVVAWPEIWLGGCSLTFLPNISIYIKLLPTKQRNSIMSSA